MLGLAAGTYFAAVRVWPQIARNDRVYRIGWQDVAPFQYKADDGSPAGVVIDMIRDAARKRGIRLQWIWYPGSSEAALRNREVDLWPLITITPERQHVIHISKPYFQHDFSLLVRSDSPYFQVQDMASASISYRGLPIGQQRLHRVLPHAKLFAVPSQKEAVENICTGRTDAAYLDEFTAGGVLLSGISCSSRVIPLPMLRAMLGVGSTLEASAVADEIRRGIDVSVLEEEVARLFASGKYFSPRHMEYFSSLLNAQRRERWLIAAVSVFTCLLALTIFAADRIRRQRNRIKATERALRQSEQKLRLMANNLSDMVMAYDMDGRLMFANAAVGQITGYPPVALQKAQFLSWVHPDDRSRMLGYWDQLFRGGAYRDEEYRIITRDGRLRWAIAGWGPIYDGAGCQVGVQCSERDITERKLAEQALRESELRFRELLEGVQLAAVMVDLNGTIRFCNDYTLTLTGWGPEEIVGRPAKEFLDWESPLELADESPAASARSKEPFVEGSILTKNGGRLWIHWSRTPLRDSAGRATGFASLGEDVTELRHLRAEAARRESEEKFREMADSAPVMIWVAGPDKVPTFFNKTWLDFVGRTLEQELNNGWIENLHPDDQDQCFARYVSAFDARQSFQIEYRLRRADGEYRWLLCSGVPRFSPGGVFAGYIGSDTDITDLRRTQAETLARQKLESLGVLAGGIAHDFNNLLGSIITNSEFALMELPNQSPAYGVVETIKTVANRAAQIVRQMMAYAGEEGPVFQSVNLSQLVREMVQLLKVSISKGAILHVQLAENLPSVRANAAQIQQVVLNLVVNASEAIGDGEGVISLTVARCPAGHRGAPAFAQDGCVRLEISDTGCGMTDEIQARIFDPFFSTKFAGRGLGLSVVQGIVRGHDGAINVASAPGGGSRFEVLLPCTCAPARDGNGLPVSAAAPRGMSLAGNVLVVEDEGPLRLAVSMMLRKRGLAVIEADNGRSAVELFRTNTPKIDVVLLDLTLPGLSGPDVLGELRRIQPAIQVIVTSAYSREYVWKMLGGQPRCHFIRKPYQLTELMDLLGIVVTPAVCHA